MVVVGERAVRVGKWMMMQELSLESYLRDLNIKNKKADSNILSAYGLNCH